MNFEVRASSRPIGFQPHSAEENLSIAVDHRLSITQPRALSLKFASGHRQSSTVMHIQATTGRRIIPSHFSRHSLAHLLQHPWLSSRHLLVVDSQTPRFSTTAKYFNF
jgi:hypothetical protein